MSFTITDDETGQVLWTAHQCCEYVGVTRSTWSTYAARGQGPAPVAHLDARTPLWGADEVRDWHANRPGSPGRPRA